MRRMVIKSYRFSGIGSALLLSTAACTASWAPWWVKDPTTAVDDATVTCGAGFMARQDGCEKADGVKRVARTVPDAGADAGS